MSGTQKTGICAYCGVSEKVTRDHIPAKNLFLPATPGLITVPSCETCRQDTWRDDEYFRIILSTRPDVRSHPSMAKLMEDVVRGYKRPEARSFTQRLLSRTPSRLFTTPAGLLVSGGVHQVDHVRVFRVITRIAKGLYFHHKEKPAPASFRVEVIPEPAFPQPAAAEILERLEKKSWQEVGKGEFSYKYLGAGDGTTEVWAWLLRFYGVVPFLVLFIQSRDEGPDDTENVPDPKVIEAFSKIWGLPETLLPTQ